MIANKKALIEFFSLELLKEKFLKIGKLRENSGNLVYQTGGHPEGFVSLALLILEINVRLVSVTSMQLSDPQSFP